MQITVEVISIQLLGYYEAIERFIFSDYYIENKFVIECYKFYKQYVGFKELREFTKYPELPGIPGMYPIDIYINKFLDDLLM